MSKPAILGDFLIPHSFETVIAGQSFVNADDHWLDVSLVTRSIYGGWSWSINRIGIKTYRSGREEYVWAYAEDDPVIAAMIQQIEQHDDALDHHIQYLAREKQREVA